MLEESELARAHIFALPANINGLRDVYRNKLHLQRICKSQGSLQCLKKLDPRWRLILTTANNAGHQKSFKITEGSPLQYNHSQPKAISEMIDKVRRHAAHWPLPL